MTRMHEENTHWSGMTPAAEETAPKAFEMTVFIIFFTLFPG